VLIRQVHCRVESIPCPGERAEIKWTCRLKVAYY
jgi:hypothetical protein